MEAYGICTSRHVRTVSLVASAVDDFTGRIITGSNVRVWIEGAKPPIRKAEGWHVFIDLPAGEHTVLAEGGFYARTSCVCRVEEGTYARLKLRLTPGRNAPLPSDTAAIEGRCAPGMRLRIRADAGSAAYKLLADAKAGEDVIGIYHPDGVDIEGKLLCIIAPDGGCEYIRVAAAQEDGHGLYRLSAPLERGYPKIGTPVYPVTECCADGRGAFFAPIRCTERETEYICRREDGEERRAALRAGSRIQIEF